MRIYSSTLLLAAVFLAGCESMSERVEERFTAVPPKSRVFAGDARTVYTAVQLTFKRLEFSVSRTTESLATIEASSRIRHSESVGDSSQLLANVGLRDAGPGRTEVQLLLSEEVETPSPGGKSEKALREHGLYDTFFDTLQQVLTEEAGSHPGRPGG